MDEKEKKPQGDPKPEPPQGKTYTQEEVRELIKNAVEEAAQKKTDVPEPPPETAADPPKEDTEQGTPKKGAVPPAQPPPDAPGPQASNSGVTPPQAPNSGVMQPVVLMQAELEAIRGGVEPEMAQDAVYLAAREAEKAGAVTPDTIRGALEAVLARHPEWKRQERRQTGFRVGAGMEEQPAENRTLPNGKVIF